MNEQINTLDTNLRLLTGFIRYGVDHQSEGTARDRINTYRGLIQDAEMLGSYLRQRAKLFEEEILAS